MHEVVRGPRLRGDFLTKATRLFGGFKPWLANVLLRWSGGRQSLLVTGVRYEIKSAPSQRRGTAAGSPSGSDTDHFGGARRPALRTGSPSTGRAGPQAVSEGAPTPFAGA
jgi:hypothetical protein